MRRNRPSYTALKVARGVIWMEGDPAYAALLPDGAAECTRELLTAAGLHKRWHERLFRMRWHRRLVTRLTDRMAPGQLEIVGLRKRLVEDEVRAAIADGITQVLIVGAGYDTLTLRLGPEYEQASFFELDHPATQRKKNEAIERIAGGVPRPNLHMVPADLSREKLGEVLRSTGAWSPGKDSIVVAEGVLMYLDEADVVKFFEELRRCTGPGTRVIFSHLRADSKGRPELGRWAWSTRAGLRVMGESIRWAIAELDPFLAANGLRRLPPAERADLIARYRHLLGEREVSEGIEAYAVVELGSG